MLCGSDDSRWLCSILATGLRSSQCDQALAQRAQQLHVAGHLAAREPLQVEQLMQRLSSPWVGKIVHDGKGLFSKSLYRLATGSFSKRLFACRPYENSWRSYA